MLDLPGHTDDGTLAVSLHLLWRDGHGLTQPVRAFQPERLQVIHEPLKLRLETAGKRVLDDGRDPPLAEGHGKFWPAILVDGFDIGDNLADGNGHDGWPVGGMKQGLSPRAPRTIVWPCRLKAASMISPCA